MMSGVVGREDTATITYPGVQMLRKLLDKSTAGVDNGVPLRETYIHLL